MGKLYLLFRPIIEHAVSIKLFKLEIDVFTISDKMISDFIKNKNTQYYKETFSIVNLHDITQVRNQMAQNSFMECQLGSMLWIN